jgi:hypothetical protein
MEKWELLKLFQEKGEDKGEYGGGEFKYDIFVYWYIVRTFEMPQCTLIQHNGKNHSKNKINNFLFYIGTLALMKKQLLHNNVNKENFKK